MQEAEAAARKIAAEYRGICACPWGTGTKSLWNKDWLGRDVGLNEGIRNTKSVQICLECNKSAEYRLNKATDASQELQYAETAKRAREHNRLFNLGEWERIDGRPFLKHTVRKRYTQYERQLYGLYSRNPGHSNQVRGGLQKYENCLSLTRSN